MGKLIDTGPEAAASGRSEQVPTSIDRDRLQELLEDGAQLVEVLPQQEYEDEHLPGAVNIPLRRIEEAAALLEAARPVVVYCWDPP